MRKFLDNKSDEFSLVNPIFITKQFFNLSCCVIKWDLEGVAEFHKLII